VTDDEVKKSPKVGFEVAVKWHHVFEQYSVEFTFFVLPWIEQSVYFFHLKRSFCSDVEY
jgi:hypothetical protein